MARWQKDCNDKSRRWRTNWKRINVSSRKSRLRQGAPWPALRKVSRHKSGTRKYPWNKGPVEGERGVVQNHQSRSVWPGSRQGPKTPRWSRLWIWAWPSSSSGQWADPEARTKAKACSRGSKCESIRGIQSQGAGCFGFRASLRIRARPSRGTHRTSQGCLYAAANKQPSASWLSWSHIQSRRRITETGSKIRAGRRRGSSPPKTNRQNNNKVDLKVQFLPI